MRHYPLAILLALREREAEAALANLARALELGFRHRAELVRHEGIVAAHAERVRAAERAVAAEAGGPGELAARARWAERVRAERPALAAALGAARAAVEAVERDVAALREALAAARAASRALELHRERWRAAQARARDRADQDAADDLVSARRRAGR